MESSHIGWLWDIILNERSQTLMYDSINMKFKEKAEQIYGATSQNSYSLWCVEGNSDMRCTGKHSVSWTGCCCYCYNACYLQGMGIRQSRVVALIAATSWCYDSNCWDGEGGLGMRMRVCCRTAGWKGMAVCLLWIHTTTYWQSA